MVVEFFRALVHGAGIGYIPDMMGMASGYLAGAVPGAGIGYIPDPYGQASGHHAEAIPSAGRLIEFVFTCRMWGDAAVGKVYIIRMHTALGNIFGFGSGCTARPAPITGTADLTHMVGSADPSMQIPENIRAHAVLDGLTLQGGYNGMIGSVPSAGVILLEELRGRAGGYIMQVGEDSDWVIQTGTNLHIRGIWSGWIDGEHLQIDTAEFYEPVRDGSNLYIRSVNKSWVDGSSANIDTDFFLDPIQTGSNLYIRQDVLGG